MNLKENPIKRQKWGPQTAAGTGAFVSPLALAAQMLMESATASGRSFDVAEFVAHQAGTVFGGAIDRAGFTREFPDRFRFDMRPQPEP